MNVYIILSVIIMYYGYYNVFNALKSGETSMPGEINDWHLTKEKNPIGFLFMVFVNSWVGFLGIWLLYKHY